MVAAGVSRDLPSLLVCVRLEGGVASPLGKRKQTVGYITSEQRLQGAARGSPLVGSPGTATNATRDLTLCVSLSPGLCWLLVKKSHSPPTAPSKLSQSPALLLGHREKVIRQETAICEVIGAVKPETEHIERSIERNTLGIM